MDKGDGDDIMFIECLLLLGNFPGYLLIISFASHNYKCYFHPFFFNRLINWGTEKLSDLTKVTKLVAEQKFESKQLISRNCSLNCFLNCQRFH